MSVNCTRSCVGTSLQIANMGVIPNLENDFSIGRFFNIKNDGDEPVILEVNLADMKKDEFVETKFEPGWNPEIVRIIKQNNTPGLDLKYGF